MSPIEPSRTPDLSPIGGKFFRSPERFVSWQFDKGLDIPRCQFGLWGLRSHLRSADDKPTKRMMPMDTLTKISTGRSIRIAEGHHGLIVAAPDLVALGFWMPAPMLIPPDLWTILDLSIFNGSRATAFMQDDTLLAHLLVI